MSSKDTVSVAIFRYSSYRIFLSLFLVFPVGTWKIARVFFAISLLEVLWSVFSRITNFFSFLRSSLGNCGFFNNCIFAVGFFSRLSILFWFCLQFVA